MPGAMRYNTEYSILYNLMLFISELIYWTLYLQITIKFIDWAIPVKARWLSVDHPRD